ncbi:MAG: PIN domain nuclease [Solirubrobacterales bacterium]|nr:PIN domain nuclease [Solirubrobacterales bacterium]
MIVVDTSVWIDVLNDVASPQALRFEELLTGGSPLALTDVIYAEVLQGLRTEQQARQVDEHLRAFPVLRLAALDDFRLAAQLYRTARRKGVTIRKTLDCLIAAPCIRADAPLLHADADFDRLAQCSDLKIFRGS